MPATRFGDCSAYLFMSREYDVDYGDLVQYADYIVRGRVVVDPLELRRKLGMQCGNNDRAGDLFTEILRQAFRFQNLQDGFESGASTEPQGVQWWTPESRARYLPEHS